MNKNEEKLREYGLKKIYYDIRATTYKNINGDEKKIFLPGGIVVCLLIDKQNEIVVSRGVSVCSHLDQFVWKKGKDKALGRALQALEDGACFYFIYGTGRENNLWLNFAKNVFEYYDVANPVVTGHESLIRSGELKGQNRLEIDPHLVRNNK